MYGYIYLTTNLINNRKYIGQKKSEEFLSTKYLGSGKLLLQAVSKYGSDNFSVELLEECSSQEELNSKEIFWIQYYDAMNSSEFYNLAVGGQSPVHKLSLEEKLHISDQMKERQKNGGYMKGRHHTEETRNKMKESHIGIKMTYFDKDSWRSSVGRCVKGSLNPMYGKVHSNESKKVMSDKRSEHNLGCCWLNNSIQEKFVKEGSDEYLSLISQGFVKGRLSSKRQRSSTIIESVPDKKDIRE